MLTGQMILDALKSSAREYWFSREDEDGEFENIQMDDLEHGDIVWFSKDATEEDIKDVQQALVQMGLHLYSKDLSEDKDIRRTKSGAYSFLALPNKS